MRLTIGDHEVEADVSPDGDGVRVTVAGQTISVHTTRRADGATLLHVGGRTIPVWVEGDQVWIDGRVRVLRPVATVAKGAAPPVTPPMPGVVTAVHVAVGDVVEAGQKLVSLTAMKMEVVLRARSAGTVTAVRAAVGQSVRPGERLVDVGET